MCSSPLLIPLFSPNLKKLTDAIKLAMIARKISDVDWALA